MTQLILLIQSKFNVLINTLNLDLTESDPMYLVSYLAFIIAIVVCFDFAIKYTLKIINFIFKKPTFIN